MRLFSTVFELYTSYTSTVAIFSLPHLRLAPPKGVIMFEFRHNLWHQKTRVPGLLCGFVCMILCLDVLIQYQNVTDTQTHDYTAEIRR